jgi:hypothetical protein
MLRKVVVAAVAQETIAAFRAQNEALRRELARVERSRDDALAALVELQTAVRNRWQAEMEVQRLKRLRDVEWARWDATRATLH